MNLTELDDLVLEAGLPVRAQTLGKAWDLTATTERDALPAQQVLALITMRAKPGMEGRLDEAVQAFVRATLVAPGAISSTLHRPIDQPRTWFLVERFESEAAFGRHMASDYFRRFQGAQETLLAEPVQALFLARGA